MGSFSSHGAGMAALCSRCGSFPLEGMVFFLSAEEASCSRGVGEGQDAASYQKRDQISKLLGVFVDTATGQFLARASQTGRCRFIEEQWYTGTGHLSG